MDEVVDEKGLITPAISTMLQNVFEMCDEGNKGFVKVSKLISFLKEKATASEVSDSIIYKINLGELNSCLKV